MIKKILLFFFCLCLSFTANAAKTKKEKPKLINGIPEKAFLYRDVLYAEMSINFKDVPNISYIPSLIEHESCIYLTHSRCWSPDSQLKTSREEGAGFFQLTRKFGPKGFDILKELREKNKNELSQLNWLTVYNRPDLQIRAGVIMVRSVYNKLFSVQDKIERLKMTDAAYNGGLGGLQRERRACGLAANCDPDIWFKNVEYYCLKSKKILYDKRNACDINRHHVKDVFENKLPKYSSFYYNREYFIDRYRTRQ